LISDIRKYCSTTQKLYWKWKGDPVLAAEGLNIIRKRAAHTTNIPLTIENVLRERRIELVYENKRYWDLIRRREYHELFNQG